MDLIFLRILVFLGIATATVMAGVFFFQERLIFFPSQIPRDYTFKFKNKFAEKFLKLGSKEFHSLYFEAENAPGTIIYFHGNAGGLDSWGELASDFVDETGWSIWMVDYPGYGKSSGSISSEKQLHDLASIVFAEVKKISPQKKVVVYGRSLGSGIACRLASKTTVDGVILETPYVSGLELAKRMFPFVPSFLVRYKFPSNEWVKNFEVPTLVIHGTADEVVPYSHGRSLFSVIRGRKEFLSIEGGHHNNLSDFGEYWTGVKRFLTRL